MDLIEIDGSFGEGGGQIVRTSLTLSAITRKPFKISNIRLKRLPKPHLQPQHLMAAKAIERICQGRLIGADLDSPAFQFYPNEIQGGDYEFDIGTAGSAILVAQTIIPVLLGANKESFIRLIGGTNVPRSPGYDYFDKIFLPAIHRFNCKIESKLIRSGFFPKGNGIIELTIQPSTFKGSTSWHRDKLTHAIIRVGSLPRHIAEREKQVLQNHGIEDISIYEERTLSEGNVITIWQDFKGYDQLGIRGKLAEIVANETYENFSKENYEVDQFLGDQLLIYGVLASGKTHYQCRITNHLKTNYYAIDKFLKREITIENNKVLIT